MGKLVFGMMQSLDGYVAGAGGGPGSDGYVAAVAGGLELPPPGVSLSRHFNDHVRGLDVRFVIRPPVFRTLDRPRNLWDLVNIVSEISTR
jgi:hypothetical protein